MNNKWIVYLVSFVAFLGPLTQTIYTPILPEVLNTYQTSPFLVNASISIFTFFIAIMQIVYGPLTDSKGRKKVLLSGLVLYIVASLGCFLSSSIAMLLVFRALQAIGIAVGSVVGVTVIGDLFAGAERGRAMGVFQTMVALGPVMGPVIGGFLGGVTDFHTEFLVLALTGLLALMLNARYLRETKTKGSSSDRFELNHFTKVFANPVGRSIVIIGFIQYYTLYCFFVYLPNLLQTIYHFSAEQKGLMFLPMSLMIVVGSTIGGRIQERMDRGKFLMVTSGLIFLSILSFVVLAKISLVLLIGSLVLYGLSFGASLPVQMTLLTFAFKKNRATAVGVYNFVRYNGMAVSPLVGSFLEPMGSYVLVFGVAAVMFVFGTLLLRLKPFREGSLVLAESSL